MSPATGNGSEHHPGDARVPGDVLDELEAILASEEFRSSRRCREFLRHIVEAFYRDSEDSLKERTLGIELFRRPPDYDTGGDAIVRVTAHETRRRLASYQLAHKNHAVSIMMKAGSYVPCIDRLAVMPEHPVAEHQVAVAESREAGGPLVAAISPEREPSPKQRNTRRTSLLWGGVLCLLLAGIGLTVGVATVRARNEVVRGFWAPLFSNKKIIICTSKPDAYVIGQVSPLGGDADLALRIRDKLAAMGHPTRMAIDSDLSESDFQEAPAVLIGSSGTNRWTANDSANFRFRYDDVGGNRVIRDAQNPDRAWRVSEKPDASHATEDYAIVTRLTHSRPGPALIVIAGASSLSTHASGVALLSSKALSNLLKEAPNDWPQKNLQIVIRFHHSYSVDDAPQVVAAVYW